MFQYAFKTLCRFSHGDTLPKGNTLVSRPVTSPCCPGRDKERGGVSTLYPGDKKGSMHISSFDSPDKAP